MRINPLNAELNPICHLLALLWSHHILHVSGIKVQEFHYIKIVKSCEISVYVVLVLNQSKSKKNVLKCITVYKY